MGGAVSAGENNDDLIDNLLEADYIKTLEVERVFRAVDRARYLTKDFQENAYKDLAWKSGNLHISAPCIYSEVMESLKLSPGLSFLNLGSGTGYLSTMVGLILGPYGVNHGIEIHDDVVQYANEKLNEFCRKSTALDEYEFCKPKFVRGNCLTINTDERLYDRVYCGAACPEHHENYMKNLIKIGGVLVMPLNDQLLQIIRTSETTWDVKAMLPVSFASLLLPEQTQMCGQVKLPDSEPLCLQAICRSTIRCLLRENVEQEHPNLKTRRRTEKKLWKKRTLRRFVVPIFEESDGEENARNLPVEDRGSPDIVYNVDRHDNQMATVIDWARSLAQASHDSLNNAVDAYQKLGEAEVEEERLTEPTSVDTVSQQDEINKRVKVDSGIGLGDDIENGKGLSSDSEGSMDIDTDSDESDIMPIPRDWHSVGSLGGESEITHRPGDPWIQQFRVFTGTEESEEESPPSPKDKNVLPEEEKECRPRLRPDSYGKYMRGKIQDLPLPIQLKNYLNLYRDF